MASYVLIIWLLKLDFKLYFEVKAQTKTTESKFIYKQLI